MSRAALLVVASLCACRAPLAVGSDAGQLIPVAPPSKAQHFDSSTFISIASGGLRRDDVQRRLASGCDLAGQGFSEKGAPRFVLSLEDFKPDDPAVPHPKRTAPDTVLVLLIDRSMAISDGYLCSDATPADRGVLKSIVPASIAEEPGEHSYVATFSLRERTFSRTVSFQADRSAIIKSWDNLGALLNFVDHPQSLEDALKSR